MARKRFRPPNKWLRSFFFLGGGAAVIAAAVVIRFGMGDGPAEAGPPTRKARTRKASAEPQAKQASYQQPAAPPVRDIVAQVNGRPIKRSRLAQECIERHGEQVLESIMNRHMIQLECRKHNIVISPQHIDAEIDRVARRFGLPIEQWLGLLEAERGISAEHYRSEIIWPTIALRSLAAEQMEVTRAEIEREKESRFGPQIRARIIVLNDPLKAKRIYDMAVARPEDFAKLAIQYSKDVDSASAGGLIHPIRRHFGEPTIEKAAFALRKGEISDIIKVGDQYVFLKCEGRTQPRPPAPPQMKQIEGLITETIRDRKLRTAGTQMFQKLQASAQIENIFNHPAKRQQMPGVAAVINGQRITMAELADACLVRHGRETVQNIINLTLLEMELAKRQITVTRRDVDAEIARAAAAAGIVTPDNKPDFPRWLQMITEENDFTEEMYIRTMVWPSAALKKMVIDKVEVTNEDMQRSFEANYGPRVRCRVIVMSNQRRAQEVWNLARQKPTVKNFAALAQEYSADPGSRSLGGIIKPIQRHGGQPTLEKTAFSLKPGELSGIVQVGENYVIMFCESYTKPVVVKMAEVRDLLYRDILEKKQRLAMATEFERIMERAEIVNFLEPEESRTAKKKPAPSKNSKR